MRAKQSIAIKVDLLIILTLTGCYFKRDLQGTYIIDDKSMVDTLRLLEGDKYERVYLFQDTLIQNKGRWFFENTHHVSFEGWSDKNEMLPGSKGEDHIMIHLSFGVNWLKPDGKIYYDINGGRYYKKMK